MNHQIRDEPLSRRAHASPHSSHSPSQTSRSQPLSDFTHNINFGEDIDLVVGVTATALLADQLLKFKDSKKHKTAHLAKAGLGAAAAAAAFTMLRREHHEHRQPQHEHRQPHHEPQHHPQHHHSALDCERQSDRGRSISYSPPFGKEDMSPSTRPHGQGSHSYHTPYPDDDEDNMFPRPVVMSPENQARRRRVHSRSSSFPSSRSRRNLND